MTTSDWIQLIAAILIGGGTLALAFMTWKSIRQTRKIHRTERKDRLLNEIIEWAIDVGKSGAHLDFLLYAAEIDEEPWGELNLPTLQSSLRELEQRGKYIVKIANSLDKPILTTVRKVKGEVEEYRKSIDKIFIEVRLGIEGNLPMILKALLERDSLVNCANNLLTEATKIKTRDIS